MQYAWIHAAVRKDYGSWSMYVFPIQMSMFKINY